MKIAINGLGRIGKSALKIALDKGVNVVAVNDLVDSKTLAYLIQHDSVYGIYKKKVKAGKNFLQIGTKNIKLFSIKNPEELPWKKLKIDVVIESTGIFTAKKDAMKHIKAGAKKVIITAPSDDADITIVPGVNHKKLTKDHKIISMASCTTNCLAPIAFILDKNYGINKSFLTTVHAYTSSQGLVDMPSKKLERGRAAGLNIILTTTGAAKATEKVLPQLKGKMEGLAMRVPVACGSIIDYVAEIKKSSTAKEINKKLIQASKGELKGILQCSDEKLVSSDIIGNPSSAIVALDSTSIQGNLVKILAWYDNEYGYSSRLIDLIKILK